MYGLCAPHTERLPSLFLGALLILFFLVQGVSADQAGDWVNTSYSLNEAGKYQEALAASEKALALDPENVKAWDAKGWSLRNLGRYKEALEAIEKGLEIEPYDLDLWGNKGWTFYYLGRYEDALSAFQQEIALDATESTGWVNRGKTEFMLGKYPEALTSFDRALAINANLSDVMCFKGNTLIQMGKYQAAYEAYNKSLAIDPNNENAKKSLDYLLHQFPSAMLVTQSPLPTTIPTTILTTGSLPINQANASFAMTLTPAPAITSGTRNDFTILYGIFAVVGVISIIGVFIFMRLRTSGKKRAEQMSPSPDTPLSDVSQFIPLQVKPGSTGMPPASTSTVPPAVTDSQRISGLLEAVDKRVSVLVLFLEPVNHLLFTARKKFSEGNYPETEQLLTITDNAISSLQRCEAQRTQWETQGYDISFLESLKYKDPETIVSAFQTCNQKISQLEKIGQEIAAMKNEYPDIIALPEFQAGLQTIEQNLKNPAQVELVQSEVRQLKNAHRHLVDSQKAIEEDVLNQLGIIQRHTDSETLKAELTPVLKHVRQGNFSRAETLLRDIALRQVSLVSTARVNLQNEGAVVPPATDSVQNLIDDKRYGDAIVESEKVSAEMTHFKERYLKAQVLYKGVTEPNLISLYTAGKYDEFISACEELQEKQKKINELKEKTDKLLIEAGQFGRVPVSVREKIQSQDIPSIENAVRELEEFYSMAIPNLSLSLNRTQLSAGEWHKVEIQISNSGHAHAVDVNLSFSDDFETRWIEPTGIDAGEKVIITSGIWPRKKGNIPLEISCSYKNKHNKEYQQKFRFWIDVVDRMGTTPSTGAAATPSPGSISPFTPKPITPRQLPQELSERYADPEFIGKGGFAWVFKAKRKDGKYVAVKIPVSLDALTGKSFIAEMQNWTKLDHTNIVRVYDFNIMPMPYFEMELCDSSLADMKKPIESEEAIWIIFNICEGLKYTHARSIVHRDLKPQNILLKNGTPKISDWGLSKIVSESTSTTGRSFTPYYAAPEQINNKQKDERTDIWQLGVILYELATGQVPFRGDSVVEIVVNISTKDPQPTSEICPDSQQIEPVIMKCLAKDPIKRYQSVLELQKALAHYLRRTYTESLKMSVTRKDFNRSAYYCGDLVMVNLLTGDLASAYNYLSDLVNYAEGDVKTAAMELSEQIRSRMERGITEIPDELIKKADIIVHKVSIGFRNLG
jgi:serine/threonine protein kinase/Flp pilus assembly protein TadD